MTLDEWAAKWGIPPAALVELRAAMGVTEEPIRAATGGNEAPVQQEARIVASRQGNRLWRNNVGATFDEKSNRVIRYGLANDSKKINARIKSSDLIGITRHIVRPEDVGRLVAIFTSIEVKAPGWKYTGKDREAAQLAWIKLIISLGGIAKFITSVDELDNRG